MLNFSNPATSVERKLLQSIIGDNFCLNARENAWEKVNCYLLSLTSEVVGLTWVACKKKKKIINQHFLFKWLPVGQNIGRIRKQAQGHSCDHLCLFKSKIILRSPESPQLTFSDFHSRKVSTFEITIYSFSIIELYTIVLN